jgi:hypothetical protein
MNARPDTPSAEDVAAEVNSLAVGLGIITTTFAPFALPGLLLLLPLALPIIPLVLVAGILYLLYRIVLLPFRLARTAWRRRSDRPGLSAELARPTPTGIAATRR